MLGTGCCIDRHFLGCILYADDIILLSAAAAGLQNLLKCCFDVSHELGLMFNCSKSCCFVIGSKCNLVIDDIKLGNETITFLSGRKLKLDTYIIKQKFFISCNSI